MLKINLRLRGQNCLFPVAHHIIKTHKANSSHYNFYLDIYLDISIYLWFCGSFKTLDSSGLAKNTSHKSSCLVYVMRNPQRSITRCNNRYVDELNNTFLYEFNCALQRLDALQLMLADRLVSWLPQRSSNDRRRPQGNACMTELGHLLCVTYHYPIVSRIFISFLII